MEGIAPTSFGVGASPASSQGTQSFFDKEQLVLITTLVISIITAVATFLTLPPGMALLITVVVAVVGYLVVDNCLSSSTETKVHLVGEKSFTVNFTNRAYTRSATRPSFPTSNRSTPPYFYQAPPLGEEPPSFLGNPTTRSSNAARRSEARSPVFPGNPTTPASRAAAGAPSFPGNPTTRSSNATRRSEATPPGFPGNPTAPSSEGEAGGATSGSWFFSS